jgi:hypothetical protein
MEENIETTIKEHPVTNERYIAGALSEDGMYEWVVGLQQYVGISCALSGLRENTKGRAGRYYIDLRFPEGEVPDELLQGARRFNEAVQVARGELKREQEVELDSN